jgi:hypothetical protein
MSQVGITPSASNFSSAHAVAVILMVFNVFFINWLKKTRPAGAGFVFVL